MISLRQIDSGNWLKIAKLKVKASQSNFVASNSVSMAEAHYEKGRFPLGIYDGEKPVGFLMYGIEEKEKAAWIIRLMIGSRLQSKGRGRKAMVLLIDLIRKNYGPVPIFLSFVPDNQHAKSLYESLGFVPDGRIEDGEVVYRLS